MHKQKFWFYFRKAIFQGLLPLVLALGTFLDFVKQTSLDKPTHAYTHLYFYTSLILFVYSQLRVVLELIFSMCSDDVIFKKEINFDHSVSLQMVSSQIINSSAEHYMVVIKKIFKLRYSDLAIFKMIDSMCWFLGIDTPILIPNEVVAKLGNVKDKLTEDNEEAFLYTTLSNLYTYHPNQYNNMMTNLNYGSISEEEPDLIPNVIISKLDKSINDLQRELFNKKEIGKANV